jgi:hypothetical protein
MTQLKNIQVEHLQPYASEAQAHVVEAKGILEAIDNMPIDSQEDLDFAGEILVDVKGKKKALENERGKATRPLLDALNVIRGWFKPAVQYLDRCEGKLKTKIAEYHREQRRRQQAALEAAGDASMRGDAEVARTQMQRAQEAQVHKVSGVQMRSVIKWEVTDFAKVPRKFLMLNEKAVQQHIMQHGADAKIDGVKIWRDVSVAAKAGK